MAGYNALNPVYFLSSSPVAELDSLEDIDKEAFVFLLLPSNKTCKTQQIHKMSGELEGLLEVDIDRDFRVE